MGAGNTTSVDVMQATVKGQAPWVTQTSISEFQESDAFEAAEGVGTAGTMPLAPSPLFAKNTGPS